MPALRKINMVRLNILVAKLAWATKIPETTQSEEAGEKEL